VTGLYGSRCPNCSAQGVAEWFAWDREARYPYEKRVHCSDCEDAQEGPTDEEDIATARQFERRGLAYHYALTRAIPLQHPDRERAAELVELYTPRNLSVLVDVLRRLEGLDLDKATKATLDGIILDALDRGSSLDPHEEKRRRPRLLRIPTRYLERNVWLIMEGELNRLLQSIPDQDQPVKPFLQRAPDLSHLLGDQNPAYFLIPSATREVGNVLPAGSVSLVLVDPPRPDGVFWALCALWASWLWDTPAAHAMRPYLGRRRFDWDWHQGALQSALTATAPVLTPDSHLITLFFEQDDELTESICLAASRSGYELAGWGCGPEMGCHLVWKPPSPTKKRRSRSQQAATDSVDEQELATAVFQASARLVEECLRERGEPTPRTVIHSAIQAGLCEQGLLAKTSRLPEEASSPLDLTAQATDKGFELLKSETVDGSWAVLWMPDLNVEDIEPLGDRVEKLVRKAFQDQPVWEEKELLLHVYGHFCGFLTPDLPLVMACIRSYGRPQASVRQGSVGQGSAGQGSVGQGSVWQRREEDDPDRRQQEVKTLRDNLVTLGKHLGYRTSRGKGWDVRWREEQHDTYLFAISPTAVLAQYLLFGPPVPEGTRPCLVFPGGRAELLVHKLRRDPRLARVKDWEFIKFRHLRRLTAEGGDRRTFEAVLHLDPITEEGVQISLM
jgi:hypothetical protein